MGKKRSAKKTNRASRAKRHGFQLAAAITTVALIIGAWLYTSDSSRSAQIHSDGSAYVRRETKTPLSPALFVGKIEKAYRIAQDAPDVLDQLYCYCECDKHSGHRSLLSCYTDNHAANCDVCVDEALDAAQMMKQGRNISEIRRQIDRKYSRL